MEREPVDNFRLFGLTVLRERLPALGQELDGLRRNEDIEHVHRMRVASRRARNALDVFRGCLPDRTAQAWRRDLRRVGRALGAARDLDVQAGWLAGYLDALGDAAQFPGVARLLLRLRQARAAQQDVVLAAVDRLEREDTLAAIARALHEMIVHARVYEAEALVPDVHERACEVVLLRLEELLAFEPFVDRPERVTELHDMRIAAKHLRYTLEIFAPLYDGAARQSIKVVKELQELLGRLHDADVWLAFLPRFLEEERARTVAYFGDDRSIEEIAVGIEGLRAHLVEARHAAYRAFVEFWRLACRPPTWQQVRDTARAPLAVRAAESREALSGAEVAPGPQQGPRESAAPSDQAGLAR